MAKNIENRKKVAIVQMCSSDNPYENLALVNDFVQEATDQGAELVCFPENVLYRGPKAKKGWSREEITLKIQRGQVEPTHEFSLELIKSIESWTIDVSLGSVLECGGADHIFNTHLYCTPQSSPQGGIKAYQKIHLFRFEGKDVMYKEAKDFNSGTKLVTAKLGAESIGLSICFDLRFPELFRKMSLDEGCSALLIPSAFAQETGEVHWHSLLRARAIENQCMVFASAQWGSHVDSRGQSCLCFGKALAVDPWGTILWEGPAIGDAMGVVEWDVQWQAKLRSRLPVLEDAQAWLRR
ncbi:hypothetical protein GW916_02310 [bacterium]|nr:hypothetical protein [bacterium]